MNALRGNRYLQRLDLSGICSGEGTALGTALLENQGLVYFCLHRCRLDGNCWNELMAAISTHPALRTLIFCCIYDVDGPFPSSSEKRDGTIAIANILLVNKHIDKFPIFCEVSFDRNDWDALVSPRAECNLCRKRFAPIPKIEAPSTRAAVMTRALARVERKALLVWMALSQNNDVVCSFTWTQHLKTPSRFRRERAVGRLPVMARVLT
jgi:hypothetical protein